MLDRRPEAQAQSDPFEQPRVLKKQTAVNLSRIQKTERAKRLLKTRPGKVHKFPGPVGAVTAPGGRTHRLAIHQAERAGRLLQNHRGVELRAWNRNLIGFKSYRQLVVHTPSGSLNPSCDESEKWFA